MGDKARESRVLSWHGCECATSDANGANAGMIVGSAIGIMRGGRAARTAVPGGERAPGA
jgi:hypothetical protein